MNKISEIISSKRKKILSIAKVHGIHHVRVFGSFARGSSKDDSDVDLLVSLDIGASLLDIIAFKQDVEDLLGRKVDVLTEASLSPYIREDVFKEAVNL